MSGQFNAGGISNSGLGNSSERFDVLNQVRTGMDVYDVHDNRIGSVEFVHLGAATDVEEELGTGPARVTRADDPNMRRDTIIDNIAEAFDPVDVPRELKEKLLYSGFIRLDTAGLFAADRFITPDQIVGVSDGRVMLSVDLDQLPKRH